MRKFLLISGERSAPKIIKLEDSHMFYPKSLQQRLAIFVLFPILKLQRAAHSVDMRLSRTKEWIQALDIAGENRNPDIIYGWIVNQLKNIEGVSRVNLTWIDKNGEPVGDSDPSGRMGQMGGRIDKTGDSHRMIMRRFHRARIKDITPPKYDSLIEHKTVSLNSDLIDKSGQTIVAKQQSFFGG
jgi:hypothetical protein